MNGLKIAAAALLLSLGALSARAEIPSVNYDANYTWQVGGSSFTSVTSKTVSVNPNLSAAGYFVGGSTPNVVGYTYSILPVGSSATFTISQTTGTFSVYADTPTAGFNSPTVFNLYSANQAPLISTTTAITIPAGSTMRDAYVGHFQAMTKNPVFNFTGLSTAATYYVIFEYGLQRR